MSVAKTLNQKVKTMEIAKQIPEAIAIAVNGLLNPYGINVDTLIKTPQNDKIKYLTPAVAAKYASMSRWTIFRAIKAGKLPAMKMNKEKTGKVLIDIADLDRWIRKHKIQI